MTEADRVPSTPPLNPSSVQGLSRRTALVGLAALPVALPAAAVAEPDPVFAAIEAHRAARKVADAAFAAAARPGVRKVRIL